MAVTVRNLRRDFEEFRNTNQTLMERKIADAVAQVAPRVWGARTDLGVKYLAAHLIAINPMGEDARLAQDTHKTVYLLEYKRLLRQVTSGFRVT